jgi:hypothetical protein
MFKKRNSTSWQGPPASGNKECKKFMEVKLGELQSPKGCKKLRIVQESNCHAAQPVPAAQLKSQQLLREHSMRSMRMTFVALPDLLLVFTPQCQSFPKV